LIETFIPGLLAHANQIVCFPRKIIIKSTISIAPYHGHIITRALVLSKKDEKLTVISDTKYIAASFISCV
jgi:hypothetical protein